MTELEKRIEALEKYVVSLQSGNIITVKTDQALTGRGFMKIQNRATGAFGTQIVNVAGGGGGTVTVPAQPSGTISILLNGKIYKLIFA